MTRLDHRRVSCGTCRACCTRAAIFLHPEEGDDVASYQHHVARNPITDQFAAMLARKPNGECVYLGPDGCTIHGRHPVECRVFDCGELWLRLQMFPRATRKRIASKAVLEAGRKRAGFA